jgi:hypothetical protein
MQSKGQPALLVPISKRISPALDKFVSRVGRGTGLDDIGLIADRREKERGKISGNVTVQGRNGNVGVSTPSPRQSFADLAGSPESPARGIIVTGGALWKRNEPHRSTPPLTKLTRYLRNSGSISTIL